MNANLLKKYTGIKNFCCPWHTHRMAAVDKFLEPGSIELKNIRTMVRIVPETAKYVYTEYTPLKTHYKPGSRLSLEAIVGDELIGATSDVEKAKRLCDYLHREVCRRSPNHWEWPGGTTYYGGTEEEVIARKTNICSDLARVFVALCQVAGIPARMIYNMHVIAEAHVGGSWALFDMNYGLYYTKRNGKMASAWDICRDRTILENHPRYTTLGANYKAFYHKLNAAVNYFVWDKHTAFELRTWQRRRRDFPDMQQKDIKIARSLPPCPVTGEKFTG